MEHYHKGLSFLHKCQIVLLLVEYRYSRDFGMPVKVNCYSRGTDISTLVLDKLIRPDCLKFPVGTAMDYNAVFLRGNSTC